MRINRLELKAFGPFTDRTLDFSSNLPGLHVVYGPNEAGKSSSLRALQALFFGFPARTGDNFLHSYDQLLVRGCLQGNDGSELVFSRRKKNKNSLFDSHDNPLEPALLHPYLHGLDQGLFTTLYGINHETLVQGGQGILDQQGEVGQALFAAGTGLASLKTIVDDLEVEGDRLFKPRGSTQEISVALTHYKELQAQLKQVTLSSREWQDHQRALDEALEKLEELNSLRGKLNKEKRQLERLKQALPYLSQRRSLLEKLTDLGDVIVLPADFGDRRRALAQEERDTCISLNAAEIRLLDLEEKRKGVSCNQGLLDHAEAIEELHQELGQYRKAKADRPQLEGRRIGNRTDAGNLLKQIRPELSINDVEILRPSLAKRKTVQTLVAKHEALVQGVKKTGRLVQSLTSEIEQARCKQQQLSPVADLRKLSQVVLQVQKAGELDGELTTKQQIFVRTQKGCTEALTRLGLWSGPLDLVGQLAIPSAETVHRFEKEILALVDEKRQLLVDREQLQIELTKIVEQRHEIEYAAEVPTEEDLSQYRNRRDQGWQLLRRQWIQKEDVEAESCAYDPEQPLPDAYEKQVAISDQTADRLYREAERVQKHASLKARAEGIEKRLLEVKVQLEFCDSSLLEINCRWQELWSPCTITPLPPREMQAWLNSFDKLRFQTEELDKVATEVKEKEAKRTELRSLIIAELALIGAHTEFAGEDLASPLQEAEELLQRLQGEQTRRETQAGKLSDLDTALETARQDQGNAEEELKEWQSLWEEVVAPLGIASKTLPAEALDFIDTLHGCFEKLKEADEFRKRIEGIDRDASKFEGSVKELTTAIALDLASLDAPEAVMQLKSLLGRASQDQALVQQYTQGIDSLNESIGEAKTALASIDEQITALRQLAACETEEQLNEAERRSSELLKLKEKLDELDETLARIAEGGSLAALEAKAQGIDPDELPGKIEGLTNEIEMGIDPEIRQLSETIGREKNELARMDGSGKAAELADASQQTLAKMRRLTERYVRVKLATKMLREEIERYRAENQDPVIKIASRYFNELTLGSFAGLRTDIDDHEQPIMIGVRPSGAWLQVDGMSSGTRDQLYLALRLATIEWRAQSSEPMPFIVDDILINFDDERSAATLKSLAVLAEKTQVILFTHHGQVRDAAKGQNMKDKIFIHQL
jgi:uncharacterized protein YhaN